MLRINFPIIKQFSNGNKISFKEPFSELDGSKVGPVVKFERKYLHNIIGLNGLGKTTFMNIISLLTGFEGAYNMDENDRIHINLSSSDANRDRIRLKKFSYIFQDPHIINMYTIEENLQLVNQYFNIDEHFNEMIMRVEQEISSDYKDYLILKLKYLQRHKRNSPYYLSGGEKQLLSFIRALINPSHVIFADEPWANMDQKLKNFVEEQLYKYLTNEDIFSNIRDYRKNLSGDNVVVIITHMHHHYSDSCGMLDSKWTKCIPVTNKKDEVEIEPGILILQRYKSNFKRSK